ncbi:S24 family peptidase [Desulfobacula sp.]|uniref:S24 family peptidase n=1 Tax=Desulfobacula sp. TaxID=2593537 RepID=UPI002608854C|nr:S24 family peptidase [Desulfobacula sp.]
METADYFRKAVQEYLSDKERGSQTFLATSTGIEIKHLNDFLAGRRTMKESFRLKITNFLGYDYLDFLQHGKRLFEGKQPPSQKPTPFIVQTNTSKEKKLLEENAANYKGVPLLDSGRLAAWSNGSAFDEYETPTSEVVVYIPELGHRVNHTLVAARVGGDSMEPLIPENSIIIIDKDDREFIDNKVFAIAIEDGGVKNLAVKRVRKFEKAKGFLLLSENHKYQPRLVVESDWLRLCVGRVIWMWRSFNG